jgi:hypothetical protein
MLSAPSTHPQEFSQQLKAEWGASAMGRIDMNYLARWVGGWGLGWSI